MRILLVEDDESIIEVVTATLDEQNYVVDVATDGESGWELIEAFPYDLVLLDIVLPKLDGISLCRRLRNQKKQVLVMLLTAKDKTTDKLIGLDAGADDYFVKPFDIQELAARIRALLRRGSNVSTPVLTCGNLCLDPSSCEVTYNGQLLRFSRKEYLLLELFLRHQHRVFSRSAIVDQIWSFSEDPPNEDTVKSHIKSIRRKLDTVGVGNLIETLYGQGYRINPIYLENPRAVETPEEITKKQQALELSVTQLWQRTKETTFKRISLLKQAAQALKNQSLDQDLQQQAIQDAHKLAGSLGTFGFETGSQLAQQLENLLQSELYGFSPSTQKQIAGRVEQLVTALQQTVGQDDVEISVIADPVDTAFVNPTLINKTLVDDSSNNHLFNNRVETHSALLLICGCEHDLTEALTIQAKQQNLRTRVAATLDLAQTQCQQERPDIAIIDFSLLQPELTKQPWQLLADLHQPPNVPIILLSNKASSQERVEAVHLGGQLFLEKPLTAAEILQAVGELLHAPRLSPQRILVVDDDPLITEILNNCLKPQGIQLTSLEDPTLFWETLQVVNPHLLILDINMPSISGLELCQTVRHDFRWSWLPIVFLTAQTDEQIQQQVFSIGADDLIMKPIVPDEVSTRIFNRLRRTQLKPGNLTVPTDTKPTYNPFSMSQSS